MGRKILISFVGTGQMSNNDTVERKYRKAQYKFGDQGIEETSFISSALGTFLHIDTYFLFGTMKSMWEEVYYEFAKKKNLEIDEDYWMELSEKCGEHANHASPLEHSLFENIENVLGNESKICPIYYGINKQEIESNFSIFADAMESLKDGDEVFLDITHSFRSLPLFATTALSFIRDISDKKIYFSGIYYGIFEAKEAGVTPIVDLSYISELQNWIKGAYTLNHFGNGSYIAKLLAEKDKTTSEKLTDFTNILSMNFIHQVKAQINILTSLADKEFSLPEKIVLPKTFKSFTKRFSGLNKQSEYQLELSKWHKENANYALSYLCLIEAIVTYVCEKESIDSSNKDCRESAKGLIMKHGEYEVIKGIFDKANSYRKSSAHLIEDKNNKAKDAVSQLNQFQKDMLKIINNAH